MSALHSLLSRMAGLGLAQTLSDSPFYLPPEASSAAGQVDFIFDFILWISIFFFVLIVALMIFFIIRYRAQSPGETGAPIHHHTGLEITWTAIPIVLVLIIFWVGFKGYLDMATPPANAYQIQVTGQKWKWQFTYPNGYVDENLHVPVDRPVVLLMSSTDVIHSLYIPAFRIKRDVMPGRYSKTWFEATSPGDYPLYCAEYCGTGHSDMLATVKVHPAGEFKTWLEAASNFLETVSPEEGGRMLYEMRGCKQCHSLTGEARVGPSFYGLFGQERIFADGGKRVADENYVRQSILEPQSQVVAGFEPVMPTFAGRLRDQEIDALIAFIKSLEEGK